MDLSVEEKVKKAQRIASDFDYLRCEFEGKLYGDRDGAVSLVSMIKFAKDYDYILEHIISLSKDI